ncbi:MAG: hypothetical protein Q4B70_12150, partial [Lachnospiraceae bacterium]|nr:hypothetical protein [Lachnospiraceae bacterium]
MNFLDKLERKFGRYAIHNLSRYLIILYVLGAIVNIFSGGTIYNAYLSLNPYMILHGEIWRIFTFLIATPTSNLIFLIFVLLFYYNICAELEYHWGDFRFNMYILVGVLGTILAAFLLYFITGSGYISMDTYYLNLSLFLAYAASFPDATFYLYAVIPVKAKWLGILDGVLLLYSFISGGMSTRVAVIVAMLNFLLFFFATRNYHKYSPKQVKRRKSYIKEVKTGTSGTRHRCHVCGRTELDYPSLEFRY